ncbi:hypothetical protein MAR_003969 [Mya arenaria]|uniref:Uncharacterized protein n=1 Tax=Mya arenaria TaxID=6604 RepID=A0ABY7EZI6_MYAAR|nr:hypothetical protein MAR_003969 [Mya arenaria]
MFVSACNAAGLCSTCQTNELLIDASPPHTGGFMQPMSWKNYITANKTMVNVTLSWYGFTDEESEIKMYYITVSRSYSGEDMSEGKLSVIPTDDGKEITASFTLNNEIITNEKIVLTILAENYAGLNSTAAKVTVVAVQTGNFKSLSEAQGYFEIEKHSCDVHYCDGSCTCAVFGRPCLSDEIPECSSKADIKTNVNISTGLANGNDIVQVSNVGLSTNFTVTRVRLEPGIKYFFTVTAVNILGLNSQKSSDGFLIDTDNPIHGVVYNTGRFMDSSFQGEADSLNISWTGFVDHYSGIQSYYVALAEVNETLNQGDFIKR